MIEVQLHDYYNTERAAILKTKAGQGMNTVVTLTAALFWLVVLPGCKKKPAYDPADPLKDHSPVTLQHSADVYSSAFHPDGRRLMTGNAAGQVTVWSVDQFTSSLEKEKVQRILAKPLARLTVHKDAVWSVGFHPTAAIAASSSKDSSLAYYNSDSWSKLTVVVPGKNGISSLAFHPDGRHLYAACSDRLVRIFDMKGKVTASLNHGNWLTSVAVSPVAADAAAVIASAGASKATGLKLWSADGKNTYTGQGHNDWLHSVSFSGDGRFLASASFDGTVRIWQLNDGAEKAGKAVVRYVLKGQGRAYNAVFSPDGRYVVCAFEDGHVRIFDLQAKDPEQVLRDFKAHDERVYSLALNRQGSVLLTVSHDDTARLWSFKALINGVNL